MGKIELSMIPIGHTTHFEIKDDGYGISPEIQDQIFLPFYTTKADEEGSVLGLSICKKIVETKFNGHIGDTS